MSIQTKRAIGFGVAHLIMLLMCFSTAFALGMERFDKGDVNASALEYLTGALAEILLSPGKYLWTSWASKHLHDAFEWMLFIANSALWGVALACVYGKINNAT